ncbi:MAG: hypothetical protein CFE21_14885 [Bacteroidetes bacterium B1(2017)]|nr:MAG: hypothetical protein CFE21_14885 [Bacteroidetes bacterium B1(2017)]
MKKEKVKVKEKKKDLFLFLILFLSSNYLKKKREAYGRGREDRVRQGMNLGKAPVGRHIASFDRLSYLLIGKVH